MAFTNEWDITIPAGTEDISQGDDRIRAFKADLEERLEAMFYGFDSDLVTGDEATAGAKALNFKEQASISTPSANQITIAAKEAGGKAELHVKDEDGDEFQITTGGKIGGSNVELTAGKSLTGSSTSNININDKFTVAGATGNTVIAGSLNPASFITGGGGFIDEDSMATNSATKVCSQQSIKAYMDVIKAQLPSVLSGGNDSNGETTIGIFQIKWGKKTISGTSGTLTFASESGVTAFTNVCFQAYAVPGRSSTATAVNLSTHSPTNTKFDWKSNDADDVSPMRWFAIGY